MRCMVIPERLKIGDRVALAAPARKVTPDEMAPAIALLQSWGLQVVVPDGLYDACNQWAGDDSHRCHLLQKLLDDDSIRAIFCARGGYGTVRIIDSLDFTKFQQHPKWIVGYSDITVLHSHIHTHCQVATLHATMPINIPADAVSGTCYPAIETLRKALFDSPCTNIELKNGPTLGRSGRTAAPIVGGNLSILYSLLGSPSDIDTRDKILFIEDLDEYLYHIDRMMLNLRRNGKLDHLKGLIVGALSDMHDNAVPFGMTAEEIVWEQVKDFDYPVVFDAPYGHIGTDNQALPLGIPCTLNIC